MAGHEQVADDDAFVCAPDAFDAVGDDVPVVGHTADAFATACCACIGAKFEVRQIDVDGSVQQVERGVGEIEIAVEDCWNGALGADFGQGGKDERDVRCRVATDEAEGARTFALPLQDARGQLLRRHGDAIGGVEGKACGGAEVASGGAAAKEDGMGGAQHLFFAHVQHFAGNVAGGADMTTPLRGGAHVAAAVGAEGAIRELCLGGGGGLVQGYGWVGH